MRISTDPGARRRLLALAIVALAALAAGVAVGAWSGAGEPDGRARPAGDDGARPAGAPATGRERGTRRGRAEAPAAPGSPTSAVGQLLILRFEGPRAPGYVARALRQGRASGVVLFADNVESPVQLRGLTRGLQRAAGGSALICTDQEGGPIRTVPWAGPAAAQPRQSTPALAAGSARAAARDLRAVGVNVNLAPVADVASAPGSVMAGRTFSSRPSAVAERVRAAVGGYRRGGVAATVKHFPGLGAATANTDDVAVTTRAGAGDLLPFRAAIAAGAPLVMASHALYPDRDRARIASQSPHLLTGLLRSELGFEGAVITDSLEAAAVTDRSSVQTAAERSVSAGADLVLMTGRGSYARVYDRLLARARRSAPLRRRVDESVERVRALKRELGLEPGRGP